MVRKLDLETWNRRNHFEVFRSYGDPFFNITAEIEVSALRRHVRERDCSFFAASYFLVLKIVNEIEEFRYRIRGNDVVVHDRIHGACTVLNEDRTFSFCFFDYTAHRYLNSTEQRSCLTHASIATMSFTHRSFHGFDSLRSSTQNGSAAMILVQRSCSGSSPRKAADS